MATIYIDGRAYTVADGQNLLSACLTLGFDLPYFCWHPAMGSVGACRQCAVKQFKDEHDTSGEIVMACLVPADEGVRISIDDEEARVFRRSVIEWLMVSHPHDCPVCDEGGECHLQDMTLMTGHVYRRYRYAKRTFKNQDLGPFLTHEMNRCIQCYRCVRFYSDYAGGDDLAAHGLRNHVYFGRHGEGRLQSEFSGNLVEVCPTGVFTDKTFAAHYTRKWDLQTAPSICVHCCLGCNIIPGERYGVLRRIRARYNGSVNGYFLCDRGRFGYEFVNSPSRLRAVAMAHESVAAAEELPRPGVLPARVAGASGPTVPLPSLSQHSVVAEVAGLISAAQKAGRLVIGIGSPRASLEANYALRRLVGPDAFFQGVAAHEIRLIDTIIRLLRRGPARSSSLRDLERADATLILGEDVTNSAPMLDFSLRQWLRRRPNEERLRLKIPDWNDAAVGEIVHATPSALYVATISETKLDRLAARTYHAAPDDLARLGFAVANLLDPSERQVDGLPDAVLEHAHAIAAALRDAQRPTVISGTSCGSEAVLEAAARVAWSVEHHGGAAQLAFVLPECNSMGLALLGGRPLPEAMAAVDEPGIDVAIILENDLYRRYDAALLDRFFALVRHVVVVDHTESQTSRIADGILPAATYAESTGTLVNNEGRAQRFFAVCPPSGEVQESWRWIRSILQALGRPEADEWSHHGDLVRAIAADVPVFAVLPRIAPLADYRIGGQKIARQPHRYSGRTAMFADCTLFEPAHEPDPDSPLRFSMEGFQGEPPPSLVPRYWTPGWNSGQAFNKFDQELLGAHGEHDPGIRLIEPGVGDQVKEPAEIPEAFQPYREVVQVLPVHHIFGSEELSMKAPSIAGLAPEPYLGLSPAHAARLGLQPGDRVVVETRERSSSLRVALIPSLPDGVPVLPAGLPGLEGLVPPFHARLHREERLTDEARPPVEPARARGEEEGA